MRIILEKINDKLSYQYDELKALDNLIEIDAFSKLNAIFENSYNPIKTINGFEKMLIENEKNNDQQKLYFVDHSNYSSLFLIFSDEKQILDYVQDVCEARGDSIPRSFESALNYLIQDNTYLFKIKEFDITTKEFKELLAKKDNI